MKKLIFFIIVFITAGSGAWFGFFLPALGKKYRTQAQEFLAVKNYAKAITAYQKAAKILPETKASILGMARAYQGNGDIEKAAENFQRALVMPPADFDTLSNLSALYADKRRYDEAIEVLSINADKFAGKKEWIAVLIAAIKQDAAVDCVNAAVAALSVNDTAAAGKAVDKAIEYVQDNQVQEYLKAGILYLTGKYQQSQTIIRMVLDKEPQFWAGYKMLADDYFMQADFVKAASYYKLSLFLKNNDVQALNNLALAYARQNMFDTASEYMEKAYFIDQENPRLAVNLADIYQRKNLYARALLILQKLQEKTAWYPGLFIALADGYKNTANEIKALEYYHKAEDDAAKRLAVNADDKSAKIDMAFAKIALGDIESGEKIAVGVLAGIPNDYQAMMVYAAAKKANGDISPALEIYEKALKCGGGENFIGWNAGSLIQSLNYFLDPRRYPDELIAAGGNKITGAVITKDKDFIVVDTVVSNAVKRLRLPANGITAVRTKQIKK